MTPAAVQISAEREAELRQKSARRSVTPAGRKQRKQKERDWIEEYPDSDDTFAFIAGYTPAGFPYGTTWEEQGETPPWVEDDESEQANPCDSERAADVPF